LFSLSWKEAEMASGQISEYDEVYDGYR